MLQNHIIYIFLIIVQNFVFLYQAKLGLDSGVMAHENVVAGGWETCSH